MSQPRTPSLYATGQWSVKSPFSVDASAVYVCKAIRSFDDLKAMGIDPYTEYYEPVGIDQSAYDIDVTNLANIITLMSDTQPTVYVPDTYLLTYPDQTTVPYRHIVLAMSLGAVPDTLALDDLTSKLHDIVLNSIGIESVVKAYQAGGLAKGVDQLTHEALEQNRLARIADNQTLLAQLQSSKQNQDTLVEQNKILIELCKDNGLL